MGVSKKKERSVWLREVRRDRWRTKVWGGWVVVMVVSHSKMESILLFIVD